jgi:hypothetical protein
MFKSFHYNGEIPNLYNIITDIYPVSVIKDCLTGVDICKDLRIEILAIYYKYMVAENFVADSEIYPPVPPE